MAKVKKPSCFNCGAPTGTTVSRIKPPQFKRPICRELKCWLAWYDLTEGR